MKFSFLLQNHRRNKKAIKIKHLKLRKHKLLNLVFLGKLFSANKPLKLLNIHLLLLLTQKAQIKSNQKSQQDQIYLNFLLQM